MVWYFIGVYIINRTLHGCLEIRNFSSRVEKIFHSFAALTCEIFLTLEEKFRISVRPCNILYISTITKQKLPHLLVLHADQEVLQDPGFLDHPEVQKVFF